MKKEVLVAIVCGIVLGLIVAFFMVRQIREIEIGKEGQIKTNTGKVLLSDTPEDGQNLEITEPITDAIVEKNSVTIKGRAQKGSFLVFQSAAKDTVAKQDKANQFSVNFPLIVGENIISITMYPQDKQLRTQQKNIRVYFLEK